MQRILIRSALLICVVVLFNSAVPSITQSATVPSNKEMTIQTDRQLCISAPSCGPVTLVTKTATAPRNRLSPTRLAANQAACQYNYNQCMRGCGGMASCSNQCAVNYQGCMRQ